MLEKGFLCGIFDAELEGQERLEVPEFIAFRELIACGASEQEEKRK